MSLEQHPIPRNITGFQFKLIGDMTLRQFGYLAFGAIIGYAVFKLLPLPFPVTISLGLLIFGLGFVFAFVPYQDRPFDQWISAFIKSVFSPTQFIYTKVNKPPEILLASKSTKDIKTTAHHTKQYTDSKKMLEAYLARLPKQSTDYIDQNEKKYLAQTLGLFSQVGQPLPAPQQKPAQQQKIQGTSPIFIEAQRERPTPKPVHMKPKKSDSDKQKKLEQENKQAQQLSNELTRLKEEIKKGSQTKQTNTDLEKRFLDLEKRLSSLLTDRERLTQQIAQLKNTADLTNKAVTPKVAPEEQEQESTVTTISKAKASKVGLLNPPTTPNIITGIVQDQLGASLSNVLITIKDLRATPLRALKTNNLGQFFTSTPLSNGTFVLEVEDPKKQYVFDLIEIKLTGEIVQPLEIIAKKKVDPVREQLSKQLFKKNF